MTANIQCIVIEDEPIAAEVLIDYISQVPNLEFKGHFQDAIFASQYLQKQKVDLIFLDIHLPKIKGLDFLSTLSTQPDVIVTTAYHEYALKAFDYNVIDYLMKPIEFSRFLKATNKVIQKWTTQSMTVELQPKESHYFNVNREQIKVFTEDIVYVESLKDYSRIHTRNRSIVTKAQIGQLEIQLSSHLIRIHRSFLINAKCITSFTASSIMIGEKKLPIGRSYKSMLGTILDFL